MKKITIILAIVFLQLTVFSQIPTIKAIGGEGTYVDWPKIKRGWALEEERPEDGPPSWYNPCDVFWADFLAASSTLANQGRYNYKIDNISDDDPMTAWVEGKTDYGIGEYFEIRFDSHIWGVNTIYNGYQASPKSWMENSRVKKFKVYKNNVALCYLVLTDEMGKQYFELPGYNFTNINDSDSDVVLRFEIMDVYKGTKWQDVAISEIKYAGCCVSEFTIIQTPVSGVSMADVQEGLMVNSVNLETGMLSNTEVLKVFKQKHLSMLKIKCESKELELTSNHPLYIKDFGFLPINKYMELNKITNYEDLIDNIEFGVWDESKKVLYFEKLKEIKLITGVFETYTIGKLDNGNTFILNGFISRTY
jgi:hypothetical protein